MKRLVSIAVLAAVLLLGVATAPALAGTRSVVELHPKASAALALTQQLQAVMQTPDMPILAIQAVVLKHGHVVYAHSLGDRYVDNADPSNDLPVTNDTKYRIASISKMVAAVGVMQLVEKGKIALDADVSKYLGFSFRNPSFPNDKITTRMLLSHTSSLRDGDYYSFPATDKLSDYVTPAGAHFEGGSRWATPIAGTDASPRHYFSYQNLNYGVLATILEAVTHERFDRYMQTHVLDPLGCDASYDVRWFSLCALRNVGVLYRKMDADGVWDTAGPWYPQVDDYRGVRPPAPTGSATYVPGSNATWESPQGGLRISALDLTRVERMFMNGGTFKGHRLLQASTVRLMFTPVWTYDAAANNGDTQGWCGEWGLGIQILSNNPDVGDRLLPGPESPHWTGHLGEAYGMISNAIFDRKTGNGYVYYCAGMGADPYEHWSDYAPAFFTFDSAIVQAIFQNYFSN
jgi:CubicO group peptidase (beta-lactamase class C family)